MEKNLSTLAQQDNQPKKTSSLKKLPVAVLAAAALSACNDPGVSKPQTIQPGVETVGDGGGIDMGNSRFYFNFDGQNIPFDISMKQYWLTVNSTNPNVKISNGILNYLNNCPESNKAFMENFFKNTLSKNSTLNEAGGIVIEYNNGSNNELLLIIGDQAKGSSNNTMWNYIETYGTNGVNLNPTK